jgi:hypothetical protein
MGLPGSTRRAPRPDQDAGPWLRSESGGNADVS